MIVVKRFACPHGGVRRVRTLVTGAVVLLGAIASVAPAHAETIRSGDPIDRGPARADVVGYSVSHGDWITLRMRPRGVANPYTSATWQSGVTRVVWQIDVNGSSSAAGWDYWTYSSARNGRFRGEVRSRGGAMACQARATFPDRKAYQIRFRRSCIGNPARVKVYGEFYYDSDLRNPGAELYDRFPNRGWSSTARYR